MRQFMNAGYMRLASDIKDSNYAYWIPHHAVKNRFRVVVDASVRTTNGESLNSIQMVGGKLQCDLQLQIMRSRRYKIGVTTDITKMFNRIGLNPSQWDLQRIFWRESPEEDCGCYVWFGLVTIQCGTHVDSMCK